VGRIDNLKHFTSEYQPESNGRPPGKKNRATILKQFLQTNIKQVNPITGESETQTLENLVNLALLKKATEGDIQAIKEVFDTTHGRINDTYNPNEDDEQTKKLVYRAANTITNVYLQTFHSIGKPWARIIVNRGGTRSSKTYSTIQILVDWFKTGELNGIADIKTVSVVRKTLPALKRSVLRDLREIINSDNFGAKENKSDGFFSFEGRILEYFSVDNFDKVKGAKRDVLYINEANELTFEEFKQLNIRTKYCTMLDLNPDDETGWIPNEIESKRFHEENDVKIIVSTFADNLFLDIETLKEIEKLKSDPEYWQVFGLGQYATMTGLVYPDWYEFDIRPPGKYIRQFGLDFGYSPDPVAIVEQYFNTSTMEVYEREIAYDTEMSIQDIVDVLKLNNYSGETVICDAVEKREISALGEHGINAYHSSKEEIIKGAKYSRQFKRYVHCNSDNLKKELRRYKFEKDPNTGKFKKKPIDAFNHLLDASRYGIMHFMREYAYIYIKK